MKRSGIWKPWNLPPDCVALHPGYKTTNLTGRHAARSTLHVMGRIPPMGETSGSHCGIARRWGREKWGLLPGNEFPGCCHTIARCHGHNTKRGT